MRRRILSSLAKSGYTAKDYVQDGLIAMWDGIENAGWGVRTESTNKWTDLIGGITLNKYEYTSSRIKRTELGFSFDGNSGFTKYSSYFDLGINYSCEIVIKKSVYSAYESICGFGWDAAGGSGIFIYNNVVNRDYGGVSRNGCVLSTTERSTLSLTPNGVFLNCVAQPNEKKDTSWGSGAGVVSVGNYANTKSYGFRGEICCVRYYDRSLTPTEIAANYAVDKARFGLP